MILLCVGELGLGLERLSELKYLRADSVSPTSRNVNGPAHQSLGVECRDIRVQVPPTLMVMRPLE